MSNQKNNCIVYVYQDQSGRVRYVGKGSTGRALTHPESHQNEDFCSWLKEEKYTVQHAGPYRDEEEAFAVESALITVLKDIKQPLFNRNCGNGPKFRPLGLPVDKSDRFTQDSLTLSEIGQITGGALIVLVHSYDLTQPDTDAVRHAIQSSWQVNRYINTWQENSHIGPKAIVGIGGSRSRFIVGAFFIDTHRWGDPSDLSEKGKLWRVPLLEESNPDAFSLQGRKIDRIKFGRSRNEHYYWVDSKGEVLHPNKQ